MAASRWLGTLGVVALAFVSPSIAQDEKTPAAPVPSTFRSFIASDTRLPLTDARNRQNKIHCLVCENGLAPVIAVFAKSVPAADSPLAKLFQAVQPLIPKYRGDRFGSYAIFLRTDPGTKSVDVKQADGSEKKETLDKEFPDDDRTREADVNGKKEILFLSGDEVKAVQALAKAVATPQIPFGIAATKSKTTEAFGIDDDADSITILLYNRLFIAKRWTLKMDELTDEKIKEIVTAAEETITGLSK